VFTADQDGTGHFLCHDHGLCHHVLEKEEDLIFLSKNFLVVVCN
jgi:hypothetical protein